MTRQNKRAIKKEFTPSAWHRDWVLGFFLLVVALMAYQPMWQAGFFWDDDAHITPPELRSLHGLARIWTELGATQQYYPLVYIVYFGWSTNSGAIHRSAIIW